jgi:putative alpha-1,2-mannosidase
MVKFLPSFTLLLSFFKLDAQVIHESVSHADLVNPLMGTDSKRDLSNGNTFPAIGLPWGHFWMEEPPFYEKL